MKIVIANYPVLATGFFAKRSYGKRCFIRQ